MAGSKTINGNLNNYVSRLVASMYAMAETYAQNAAAMAKDPPYPDRPLRPDETRSPSGITRKRKATKGKTSKKKIKEGKLPNYKELSGNEEHLKWRDKTATPDRASSPRLPRQKARYGLT